MLKKAFVEAEIQILAFDKQDVIETSGFDGVVDVFDGNGNAQGGDIYAE